MLLVTLKSRLSSIWSKREGISSFIFGKPNIAATSRRVGVIMPDGKTKPFMAKF